MTTSMLIYLCKFFIKAAAGIGAASLLRLGFKRVITDYREFRTGFLLGEDRVI
jgi:hypothetical protein